MAYAYAWDTAAPVGTDLVSDGARVIREDVKGALNERLLTVFVNLTSEPLKFKDLTTDHNTYDLGKTAARFRDAWLSRNLTVAGTTALGALTATSGGFAGRVQLTASVADAVQAVPSIYTYTLAGAGGITMQLGNVAGTFRIMPADAAITALVLTSAGALTINAGFIATTGAFSDNLGTATGKKLGLNAGLTTYFYEESAGVVDCYLTGLHRSRLDTTNFYTPGGVYLIGSLTALINGAAAQVATMTNGPVAGNPTKWFKINDGGTDRYVPAW